MTFKSGEDAGCIRKLWGLAHQMAKKELEALASPEDAANRKVTLTMAQEMEERAIGEGMPVPVSDKEKPSLHALTKVSQAYGVGGTFHYLVWEVYLDQEWEGRLRRAGKLPRDRQELIYTGSKVTVKNKDDELPIALEIEDASDLREILDIRGRAFHMTKTCDHETCRLLTERYLSKLRATQVEGMRGPTINEIRRFDRELFEAVLSWVAKSQGSIQSGLKHFLDTPSEHLWRLLEPQIASMPDQGKERKITEKRPRESKEERTEKKIRPHAEGGPSQEEKKPRSPPDSPARLRLCIVCGQRHEPRCAIPQGFRKEARAKQKARKAAEKTAAPKPGEKGKTR